MDAQQITNIDTWKRKAALLDHIVAQLTDEDGGIFQQGPLENSDDPKEQWFISELTELYDHERQQSDS